MKNQFKPGDLIGTGGFNVPPDDANAEMRGIIVDIDRIVRKEPATYGTSQSYWCVTLLITLNLTKSKYFRRDFPVNTVKTLTITDLSKWRKINV